MSFLIKNNIATSIHYPVPVHKQPYYNKYKNSKLIITEKISKQILSLPIYPELGIDKIQNVISQIKEFSINN